MDSHEPPRERATTMARGLRNTWVDVTPPGMSWHERESAERKAHGKNWKMDTSLKRPSRAELRAAVQAAMEAILDSHSKSNNSGDGNVDGKGKGKADGKGEGKGQAEGDRFAPY